MDHPLRTEYILREPEGPPVENTKASYLCGNCGKTVLIQKNIFAGRTTDTIECNYCQGKMLYKTRTRRVQAHLAR